MDRSTCLSALVALNNISTSLGTPSYIWGGLALDIYQRRWLRPHGDIDCLTLNLAACRDAFQAAFSRRGWEARILDNGDLRVERGGAKIHLGNILIAEGRVRWTHNGSLGSLFFPTAWLRPEPVLFEGVRVHVVEPQLEVVLKTHPELLFADARPARPQDKLARQAWEKILRAMAVDTDCLFAAIEAIDQSQRPGESRHPNR